MPPLSLSVVGKQASLCFVPEAACGVLEIVKMQKARASELVLFVVSLAIAPITAAAQQESTPPENQGGQNLASASQTEDASALSSTSSADEEEKLPWRNSTFTWDQQFYTYGFDQAAGKSYDPTYAWSFSLKPRWYLMDTLYVGLREDMDYELTDSDSTTYNRQAIFSDLSASITKTKILEIAGYRLDAGARINIPISIASRANDVHLGTALFVNQSYDIDNVLAGLQFTFDGAYTHTWTGSNVTRLDSNGRDGVDCTLASGDPNDQEHGRATCGGGPSNISDSISLTVGASLAPIDRLSVDASFNWRWRRARGLADAVVPVEGAPGGEVTLSDGSDTHWRNDTTFDVSVSYDVLDWLGLSLGFSTATSQLNPDGSSRNPFYNVDSAVYLTTAVTLDKLYTSVRGGETHPPTNNEQAQQPATNPVF